jgi:hypothetical protein
VKPLPTVFPTLLAAVVVVVSTTRVPDVPPSLDDDCPISIKLGGLGGATLS